MTRSKLTLLALLATPPAFAWTPPVGIPKPAFPADLDIARPTLPANWTTSQSGFYFVAGSGCSDSNGNGTPSAPRCSLPGSAAPGDVIVLDGTISRSASIGYSGTAASPVWVMGKDPASRPTITTSWSIGGSYVIVDSIAFNLNSQDGVGLRGSNVMLRNSTMANAYGTSNGAAFGMGGSQVIFYKNVVSQSGNWQYSGGSDIDRHGIKVGGSDIWIVDSQFFHIQGDGVQVGDQNNSASSINRIYIGRNLAYENLQFGFWVKNATDVIFSGNTVHSQTRNSAGGPGGGMGGQYDPQYVWFINNTIHDSNSGIHIAGASDGGGGPWYAIGNLAYNIATTSHSCGAYDYGAISFRNSGAFTAIYNTAYNVDFFGGFPAGGGARTVRNNIFATLQASCAGFPEAQMTHDYNLYSSAAYVAGSESNKVVGDPQFVTPGSDFSLKASSPAVGRGSLAEEPAFAAFQARYNIDIRKDMNGVARPQQGRWDLGALESPYSGIRPSAPTGLQVN
ncbi:MAG: right-handed parallel beta-helix repeat-containing protein [Gammaproteobacteria bacterium]|nr:right-handed parallel beta-helix repeat-containing protein [Gammaproteobacteria bacterium]